MDKYISELISLVKNNDNWKTLLKENPYNLKTIKECSLKIDDILEEVPNKKIVKEGDIFTDIASEIIKAVE